jgi:hypothetical protein
MTAQEVVDLALDYRDNNDMYARWDLQAALEHPECGNCGTRFGTNDPALLREALELLG